jgi:energy-coupling factor transporter ATP-binding protein EcfA2
VGERLPLIDIRNVTFSYPGSPKPALVDVTMAIQEGSFVLVLGPTGGGKSTFTQLLNGAIPHINQGEFTGDVLVGGLNTRKARMHELATTVGAVFQEPEAQIINIFVRDELYFGPENLLVPAAEIRRRAEQALDLVDMTEHADNEIFELSGGQKQKVALAAVLTMQPKLLVLDQPTANLDPVSARETFQRVRRLRDELGVTIVIIEHNVDDLATLVDHVAVFEAGRLVTYDEPRAVFHRHFPGAGERLGLWTPQAVELARMLESEHKLDLPGAPLSAVELEPPLRQALERGVARFEPVEERPLAQHSGGQPLVDIRNLTYTYETTGVQALSDVNLRIEPGEFLAIIGRNGSGKSTLGKILTKILEPSRGSVFVNGRNIADISLFRLSELIGYVFQNPDHQFVTDTVYDEVAYSLRVRNVDEGEVARHVTEILDLFHLAEFATASPFSLSVGERRLLSVGTMLVLNQQMVILDEPTIGQDQAGAAALMGHLRNLNAAGKTIVMITHDMRLLAEWSERAIVMSRSHLLFDGSVTDIFSRPQILQEAALIVPPVVGLTRRLSRIPADERCSVLTPKDFVAAWQPLGAKAVQAV